MQESLDQGAVPGLLNSSVSSASPLDLAAASIGGPWRGLAGTNSSSATGPPDDSRSWALAVGLVRGGFFVNPSIAFDAPDLHAPARPEAAAVNSSASSGEPDAGSAASPLVAGASLNPSQVSAPVDAHAGAGSIPTADRPGPAALGVNPTGLSTGPG